MGKININMDSLRQRREWKRHKITDGDNIYRVLPPFGDVNTHNNWPFRKWTVVWNLVDPKTGRSRPFGSPMLTEKRCPATEYVDKLVKKADGMSAKLKAEGLPEKEIKERLAFINQVIRDIRPRHVYAYNAANKANEVGILELKPTAHKGLQKEMMQYIKDYNQDPTSLNGDQDDSGVWFKISREGTSFDTEYKVGKNQTKQKINGSVVFVDDRSPLSDSVREGYDDMGYDLASCYQVKSYDELKEILLLNIKEWTKDGRDEIIVEGFDPSGVGSTSDTDTPPWEPETPAVSTKPAKSVALKVELDGEEEDVQVTPSAKTAPASRGKSAKDLNDDEVFAMAKGILDD